MKQPWLASGPLGCVLLASQLFAQQTVQSGPKTGGSMPAPLDVALIAPNVPTANAGPLPPPPIKVALSGKALQRFTVARKLAVEYVGGKKCSSFLSTHSFEPAKLIEALTAQQPQDGPASSITFLEAGITGAGPDPHGGDSVRTAFTDPEFRTMAISQPLGSDTYYNPQLLTRKLNYPYSNPVSVIHEALHNLSGESDVAVAQNFGYHGFVALEANIFINDSLKKHCDSKH